MFHSPYFKGNGVYFSLEKIRFFIRDFLKIESRSESRKLKLAFYTFFIKIYFDTL
nr:MAG TPA: hypothetical protein [Caudoviricetes sp.]